MIVMVAVGPARSARSNGEAHVRLLTYAYRNSQFWRNIW